MRISEKVAEFPPHLPSADHHIKIPDGIYVSDYVGAIGFFYLGRSPRVAMCFRIVDDVGSERHIIGYYRTLSLTKNGAPLEKDKRTRNPDFQIGWRSRLARDLGKLFAEISSSNLPRRIPTIDRSVRIKTATVREDKDGVDRPESFWSSKIDHILGWAE